MPGLPPGGGGGIINNVAGPYTTNNPATGNEDVPAAIISVSKVGFDDPAGVWNITGPADEIWNDFLITSRYENDLHRYMAGVSSPSGFNGGTAAFLQLAAPTLLWVVDWTASRYGTQPEVPDPFLSGTSPGLGTSNWVLLDIILEPGVMEVSPDGNSPFYRISGIYVYGHMVPDANPFVNINFTNPFFLQDAFDRTMPLSKLQKNLITAPGVD